MNARLRSVALALAALLLLYGLAFGDQAGRTEDSRPLSTEPGPAGYSALRDWWASSGVRLLSLRDDYPQLERLTRDHPTGNLLVVTLPGTQRLSGRDLLPLNRWVRSGNSMLVLAAICDSPEWAPPARPPDFAGDVAMLASIELPPAQADASRFLTTPEAARWLPTGLHPLSAGAASVESLSDRSVGPCEAAPSPGRGALAVLRSGDGARGGAWLMPRGEGWVLVMATATPFSNRALGRAGNARFAADILRELVSPSGAVIFDDGLQGAPRPYDLRRLLADPRMHASLLALLALWLAWVAGGTRLRAPVPAPHPPGQAALVAAEGRLLARAVEPREAARARMASFIAQLPEAARASPESWLAGRPGVAAEDAAQLGALRRRLEAGGAVPLDPLHDLLTRLRRCLP